MQANQLMALVLIGVVIAVLRGWMVRYRPQVIYVHIETPARRGSRAIVLIIIVIVLIVLASARG
jgi:hypothetical protein